MSEESETGQDQHEISTFVVRVWLEESVTIRRWRGHITHVLSGERQHFDQLDVMNEFILQHIDRMKG